MSGKIYDDRRRVAEALRYISGHPPEWATSACCIAEVLDADYPLWEDPEPLFSGLADLIDHECINENVDTAALLALADRFECGSSDFMTRKEIAKAIREAVGE